MENVVKKNAAELEEHFDQRLDNLEKLLKLSLLSALTQDVVDRIPDIDSRKQQEQNLYNEINGMISDRDRQETQYSAYNDMELNKLVESMELTICNIETYADKHLVFVKPKIVIDIQEIGHMIERLNKNFENIIPVFMFNKLNGIQKKQLMLEQFSYCIHNQEIHIVIK